jgi:FMN reductase
MAHILTLTGSPSASSRTAKVLRIAEERLAAAGHTIERLAARELPAGALLGGRLSDPAIRAAIEAVDRADGVIVATPVYQGSYTGLLKALLDVLPQRAFAGKAVLPLATGGSPAHILMIDYALRPVLTAMGARHVVQGYVLLETLIGASEDGRVRIDPAAWVALRGVLDGFEGALGGQPRRSGAQQVLASAM